MSSEVNNKSLGANAALNVIKQACSIVFPLITFTYSAHILGPANIGIFSFCLSIISYFALIAGLGISTYAIREGSYFRDDKQKINSFASEIFTINLISTAFAYVLLFVLILIWNRLENCYAILIIQSTSILLTTLGADWINSIYEDYFYLAVRYITFQVIALVMMFLFVRSQDALVAYTVIMVIGSSGGNVVNWLYVKKYVSLKPTFRMRVKVHILPILFLFGNSLAVTVYVSSDITILGVLASNQEVGIYSIAAKVYSLVKQLLNAITVVTIPRFSFLLSKDDYIAFNKLGNSIIDVLILFLLPLNIGLLFEGGHLLYVFAGEEYVSGTLALQLLSASLFFAVGGCFLVSSILIPLKQERKVLAATSVAAVINIILNLLIIPVFGMDGAAFSTIIAELFNFSICVVFAKKHFKLRMNMRNLVTVGAGSVIVLLACYGVNYFVPSPLMALIASLCISIILYFAVLLIGHNEYVLSTAERIKSLLFR